MTHIYRGGSAFRPGDLSYLKKLFEIYAFEGLLAHISYIKLSIRYLLIIIVL